MADNAYFPIVNYGILDWDVNTVPYREFDVVRVPSGAASGQYLVSTSDNNTGVGVPTGSGLNVGDWINFQFSGLDFTDIWQGSYESAMTHEPRTIITQFGDGYFQRAADGANHEQLIFDVTFKDIPNKEAKSLLSFFEYKGSVGKFKLTLPDPYGVQKIFVATNWTHQFGGFNRNTVTTKVVEVFDQSFE